MKKTVLILLMAVFGGLLSVISCQEENLEGGGLEPVFDVRLESVETMAAIVSVTAENLLEVAYAVNETEINYANPAVVFSVGTVVEPKSGTITLSGLDAGKTYYLAFAARVNTDDYYDEILKLTVSTKDFDASDLITIIEKSSREFKARISVPESVRVADHAIKWQFWSLPLYLLAKYGTPAGYRTDAEMVAFNGNYSGNCTQKDTTIYVSPDNEYVLDENGDYYVGDDGEMIMHHVAIAPGEPTIFMAAEFGWGNTFDLWGYGFGVDEFDNGYFEPPFPIEQFFAESSLENDFYLGPDGKATNSEDSYWTGAFQRLFFTMGQPEELDTDMEVNVVDVTPVDATIDILIDENVYTYSYFICSDALYKVVLNDVLLGHEEWMQWLVCSYYGFEQLQMMGNDKSHTVHVIDENGSVPLQENTDYHIFVTATSDFEGTKQRFFHETFSTDAKRLPAPVIEVTPVESGKNEYEAKFNIKAPNKDVVEAKYGANYKRNFILDWNGLKGSGESYSYFTSYPFSLTEIDDINSDAGLTISIPSLDGETIRLAVSGRNSEYTYNELLSPETQGPCTAVADCKTKLLDLVPQVSNPLFEALVGDWSATTDVWVSAYDANNNQQEYKSKASFNVTIAQTVDTPELTEDVYQLYADVWAGQSGAPVTDAVRARVDAEYEIFRANAEIFNKYRLVYRNRLLCLGWMDYDFQKPSRLSTRSAFDLFCSDDYNSVDVAQLFYEFGPKWYLEIAADGTVTVPFDDLKMPPMTAWQNMEFYLGAYDRHSNHGFLKEVNENMPGRFPVEISTDRNTIVVKGINAAVDTTSTATFAMHYPNAMYPGLIRSIIGDITLKRNTSRSVAPASCPQTGNYVEAVNISGYKAREKVIYKSMTPRVSVENVKDRKELETVEYRLMSLETFRSRFPKN